MNEFLAVAPHAQVAHGALGWMVSLDDLCDRPPRKLADGEIIGLGGKRIRHIDTPHVPHNWEARVLFEETTKTLLCEDLFTHTGNGPALTVVTAAPIRRLAALQPQVLALMHGSSTRTRCGEALVNLADAYDLMVRQAESAP
jgi:hypothetical protein